MILDYRQSRNLGAFTRFQGDGGFGRDEREKSFRKPGGCYCDNAVRRVFQTNDHPGLEWDYDNQWTISACPCCGYWTFYSYAWCDTATISYMESYREACLRTFDVSSIQVPVETLRDYLNKNETKFHNIHPSKFEELVGSVFRDFFNCEALHVGRSGDGGIDLIVLDSDSPLAIQVKRRRDVSTAEPVSTVREFLGATLLQGFKRGAIVTTANSFSKPSVLAALNAKSRLLVEQFDLIDFRRFLDIFHLVADQEAAPPWKSEVPEVFLASIESRENDVKAKLMAYYQWERIGRPVLSIEKQDEMYFEAICRIERKGRLPTTR